MVMSCDIISDITCIIYFLCKMIVVCGIKCIISFTYIVCVISVNGIMLMNSNTISKTIICFIYIMCFIYLLVISNIS